MPVSWNVRPQNVTLPHLQRILELTPELLRATGEELGWLETSQPVILARIRELADPTDVEQATKRSKSLLQGSLLLYLFALWEAHVPADFKKWMNAEELVEFEAFEHVRDSVAHSKLGHRASFNRKRKAFETFYPFAGVKWDSKTDVIDISDSFVVNEMFSFIMGMSPQLAARIHSGVKPSAA